ncbi:hypothetical protein KC19_VG130900 [Ceratodon purpureus]|uniref:Uncharacterized protein n=1 Tax=Ceratodon purpureus TaxID=3225 RepID=A0A8T0HPZ9_CERPU|nr:hypothetical protein KC19_VG130900 [Ceratodon purpureus]
MTGSSGGHRLVRKKYKGRGRLNKELVGEERRIERGRRKGSSKEMGIRDKRRSHKRRSASKETADVSKGAPVSDEDDCTEEDSPLQKRFRKSKAAEDEDLEACSEPEHAETTSPVTATPTAVDRDGDVALPLVVDLEYEESTGVTAVGGTDAPGVAVYEAEAPRATKGMLEKETSAIPASPNQRRRLDYWDANSAVILLSRNSVDWEDTPPHSLHVGTDSQHEVSHLGQAHIQADVVGQLQMTARSAACQWGRDTVAVDPHIGVTVAALVGEKDVLVENKFHDCIMVGSVTKARTCCKLVHICSELLWRSILGRQ